MYLHRFSLNKRVQFDTRSMSEFILYKMLPSSVYIPHQLTKEPTGPLNMATPWQFMVTHSQAYWVNSYICDEHLSTFLWKSVTYCVSQVPSTSWKKHVFPGNCTPFIGTVFQSLEIQLPEFVSILRPQTKL